VNSAVPGVTAPQLSVRLTLVNRSVPMEDAIWNAAEPVVISSVRVEDAVWNATEHHVNSAVPAATVRCSVRVTQRPASKDVQ